MHYKGHRTSQWCMPAMNKATCIQVCPRMSMATQTILRLVEVWFHGFRGGGVFLKIGKQHEKEIMAQSEALEAETGHEYFMSL